MDGLNTTIKLNNGVMMPRLGLGVWKTNNTRAKESVKQAIKHGYRLIDTAKQYGNESGVGKGIKEGLAEAHLDRKDLFVTTKLFNGDQGYDSTLHAIKGQLRRLGLDYVDLYLMHWPVDGKYLDSWKAMEKLYKDGVVRAIGVSNFNNERMQNLLDYSTVTPVLNQMEYHPLCQDKDIVKFDHDHDIQVEAWSPLGGGAALNNETIDALAKKYNKSAAQIILRWDWQNGIITIPKSSHEDRIIQNADIFDFALSADDMEKIDGLDQDKRSLTYDVFQWHNPKADPDEVDKWDDSPADYKD